MLSAWAGDCVRDGGGSIYSGARPQKKLAGGQPRTGRRAELLVSVSDGRRKPQKNPAEGRQVSLIAGSTKPLCSVGKHLVF